MIVLYDPFISEADKIVRDYNVKKIVAEYLSLIYPAEFQDWSGYEEAKGFLGEICDSTEEYEKANRCLVDILNL